MKSSSRLALIAALLVLPAALLATEIYPEGEIIVSLNPGHTIDEVNDTWGTTTIEEFPEGNLYLIYAEGVGDLELFAAQMEAEDPAVAEAEANYFEDTPEGIRQMIIVAVGGEFVDYEDQEITQRIGLDEAHLKSTGLGVLVGVIDSGVDPDHEVFQGRLSPNGYDFVDDDTSPWEEANGVDDDGDGLTDDGYGHGSMVAGIVALVAPGATILPVRALDDEGRSDAFRMAKAIRYAINEGADVLNMSFGVPRTISPIGHQVALAESLGIPVVAGAGNDSTDDPVYYPGAHSKAMLITAVDSMDIKAGFADWNSKTLVSAPGTGVRSAFPGGEWGLGSGCSFATPFVTGEVALILGLASDMLPGAVEERVQAAVDPIDQLPGNEPFEGKLGSGRVFLPLALEGLVTSAPDISARGALAVSAHPNPSRGSVTFRLISENGTLAGARVYDAAGRLVRRVEDSGPSILWSGLDQAGRRVAPGVYFAVLRSGGSTRAVPIRIVR